MSDHRASAAERIGDRTPPITTCRSDNGRSGRHRAACASGTARGDRHRHAAERSAPRRFRVLKSGCASSQNKPIRSSSSILPECCSPATMPGIDGHVPAARPESNRHAPPSRPRVPGAERKPETLPAAVLGSSSGVRPISTTLTAAPSFSSIGWIHSPSSSRWMPFGRKGCLGARP